MSTSRDFPRHHPRPPWGWVNDPNGPIRWGERYHLFFQHNPVAPVHEHICWGHASSGDLVTWDYHPVALEPTEGGPDAAGCWSGCLVDDGGVATAVYTGVTQGARSAAVCVATSHDADLTTWSTDPSPVALTPTDHGVLEFRDPFVFHHDGTRYALLGACTAEGGLLLLYECNDLAAWTLLGTFLDSGDEVAARLADAEVWECPALFRLGGRWVLLISLIRDARVDRVVYLVGDLVDAPSGFAFRSSHGGLVDHGRSFYAPTVLVDGERVLLWGWVTEVPPQRQTGVGWSGALTLTRELSLDSEARLVSRPVPALERLHASTTRHVLDDEQALLALPDAVDLLIELEPGPGGRCEVEIAGGVAVGVDVERGTVSLRHLDTAPTATPEVVEAPWRPANGILSLRVILDGSVLEIYASGGPTFTERAYVDEAPALRLTSPHARCTVALRALIS